MKNWHAPKGYVEKKYNYTYKLTFKYDERYYYYGVHSTNTEPQYDNYFGSGSNIKLYKRLYGNDCFRKEILCFFKTKEEALLAEDKLVPVSLLNDEFCLNKIQGGGTFDTTGMKMSEEDKQKISQRFKGKKRSKDAIAKMIQTRQRRGTDKHSEETKEKIRKINLGKHPIYKDNEQKRIKEDELQTYLDNGWKIGYLDKRNKNVAKSKMGGKNPMYGKHWTDEQKEKMIKTKIKNGTNKHSQETKEKLADLNRMHAKDPVFCKHLSECCKGVNTWTKGRKFIHKPNGEVKSVKPEELDIYLNNGWCLGRPKKH